MADLITKLPNYEPKLRNRWLVSILNNRSTNDSKVEIWVVKTASRPNFKKTKWWNFWKKFKVSPTIIEFNDPICPSTSQILYDFMVNDVKIDYNLEMLDPTGVCIEKWKVRGCEILEVDFGNLNYAIGDIVTCRLLLKPDTAKLVF
jgi:hypothetical protein